MNTRELIESGLLELYCIGGTSEEEDALVKIMISEDVAVRDEINAIQNAIKHYADNFAVKPPESLLRKIFDTIAQSESNQFKLPPVISANSKTSDWWEFLQRNNIEKPENDLPINMIELVISPAVTTYIAWAEKGAFLEESHSDEIERLLMLKGSCKIDMNGITHYYNEGDFVEVLPGTIHRAEAIGDGMMILIGQRLAA